MGFLFVLYTKCSDIIYEKTRIFQRREITMKLTENPLNLIIPLISIIILIANCSNPAGKSYLPLLLGSNSQEFQDTSLSNDTSISTSIGKIQGTAIIEIPFGITVESLRAAIQVAPHAIFEIVDADGTTPAATLSRNCLVAVTAENGTEALYTLYMLPDPAILAEWIGFDPASPDYTIINARNVDGYDGNTGALQFDGDPDTLDYVIIPDSDALTLGSSGTVEVLFRADTIFPFAGIVHKGEKKDFSDESWGLQLYYYQNSQSRLLFLITGNDGNWIGVHGSFDIVPGQWYHVIGTWDETSLRLYVNGVLDGSVANTTGRVRDTDGGLIIGAQLSEIYNGSYGNLGWSGVIDRVIIRSDSVSDEQVMSSYRGL